MQIFLVTVNGSNDSGTFTRLYATSQTDARTALSTVYAHELATFPTDVNVASYTVQPFGGTIL